MNPFDVGNQVAAKVSSFTVNNSILRVAVHRLQRNYMWEVVLPVIEDISDIVISDLVQDVDFADYEITEPRKIRFGAYESNYASFLNCRRFTIDFMETVDGAVSRYLSSWRSLMITRDGLHKPKSQYAKTLVFMYLDSFGAPERVLKFKNVFPLVKLVGKFTYKESGVAGLSVPFSCDRIEDSADATD